MNCKYSCLGCKQILKLNTREEHIKNLCKYRPCPCPVPGCMKYKDLKHALQQHLENEHGVHLIPFEWNNTSGVYEAEISMRVPIASLTGLVLYNGDEEVRLLLHSEAIVKPWTSLLLHHFWRPSSKIWHQSWFKSWWTVCCCGGHCFSRKHSPCTELEEICLHFP